MFEFIKSYFGLLFFESDLPGFIAAGWISGQQAGTLAAGGDFDA